MLVWDAGMTTSPATTSVHPGWCAVGGALGMPGATVGTAVGSPGANVGGGTAVGGAVGPPGNAVGCGVGKQESERVTLIAVPVYMNVTVVGIVMLVSPGLD